METVLPLNCWEESLQPVELQGQFSMPSVMPVAKSDQALT